MVAGSFSEKGMLQLNPGCMGVTQELREQQQG